MRLEIVPMDKIHVEEAAKLVSQRYQRLVVTVPALPRRYGEVRALIPFLEKIVESAPGLVALEAGRLVGFLAAWELLTFRGRRTAFSPEWANAAILPWSRPIYEAMYARLAGMWVEKRCAVHLISLLANDQEGMEGWYWSGFGMIAADAVRDLTPFSCDDRNLEIRQADPQDIEQVLALDRALCRHLAGPPVFILKNSQDRRACYEKRLQASERSLWLAIWRGEAVAYLEIGPASEDACTIIRDERTASITAAFTLEKARGRGIAAALLNRSLAWARAHGYERCAVDFEPMNSLATCFWLRHFQLVGCTVVRRIDERPRKPPHLVK